MKDKTIIIDWLSDVMEPWFNSQNREGGFITVVTKYNLFNNLEDIGVISIYADGAFQRPPIRKEVRKWFRNRLKDLAKEIEKGNPNSRILLFNGCTPQQEVSGTGIKMFKDFVMKDKELYMNDNDALLRLAGRFKSKFVNESPTILFPEPFFNVYMDDLWKYCVKYLEEHIGIRPIMSDGLTTLRMIELATAYYPAETVLPYVPHNLTAHDDDDAGLVVLQESTTWFNKKFDEAGIAKPELDPMQKQVMVKTEEDFKNNDLMKAI